MESVDWGQLPFNALSWWAGSVPHSGDVGTGHVGSGFQEMNGLGWVGQKESLGYNVNW